MVTIYFHNPQYLWFMIAVPLLIFAHFVFYQRAKIRSLLFANFETLERVGEKVGPVKNYSLLLLRLIVLISLILSLSGIVIYKEAKVNRNDFIIAVDVSASMTTADIGPSRLESTKQAAKAFIDNLNSRSKIGLIAFAGVPMVLSTLTEDREKIKKALDDLEAVKIGGTDISSAIITGVNLLSSSEKGRTIILISDGSNTVSFLMKDPIQSAIDYAKKNRVKIYTIGVGSELNVPVGYLPSYYNVTPRYDVEVLRNIALETGGKFADVKTPQQLNEMFQEINSESEIAVVEDKLYNKLLLVVLVGLFIEWVLFHMRFRVLPH